MNEQIGWRDYAGVNGWGGGGPAAFSPQQLEEINKALTAGSFTNPGAVAGDGFALRVESLENTLKVTTFKMKDLKFWKAIPKIPAYNVLEQYNVLSSYGQGDDGFIPEIALPNEEDSITERKEARIKYLGTTRRVSHVMSLLRTAHGDAVGNEQVNGTMWLLKMLERALFYADSSLSSVQFDGFEKLIRDSAPAANIIDMRGQPIDEDLLTDICATISDAPNYGTCTHVHMNPKVKQDLIKSFYPKGRYDLGVGPKGESIGMNIKSFESENGVVNLESNPFVNDGGAPLAAAGDAAKRPGAPIISTAATTPADGASLFGADDAGSYVYKITAHNDFGRSAAVDVGGAIAVAAGDKTTFGVTPNGPGATKWYQLYRTKKGGAAGTERLIARIANTAGVAALVVNDFNTTLPYTSSVFAWQQDTECLSWKQLAPMLKIPLGVVDTSMRWMQLIYGVPVLYAPGRSVLIRNVGRAPNFKGQP